MTTALKDGEKELLREALQNDAPARVDLLARIETNSLREQRGELCQLISMEFGRTGLCAYDEPNARGLDLEDLLDTVNRLRLRGDLRRSRRTERKASRTSPHAA